MAFFATPERSDANPPESWKIIKVADRVWHVRTKEGGTLESYPLMRDAEASVRVGGELFNAYMDERRWFGGETPAGRRSWEECKASVYKAFA